MINQNFLYSNKEIFINDSEVDLRDKIISSIELYKVDLTLNKGLEYKGQVEIHLTLSQNQIGVDQLFQIDFGGKHVENVQVKRDNNQNSEYINLNFVFENHRILFKLSELYNNIQSTTNKIIILISFSNQYNITLQDKGLFSTICGNNQYLYSQGEVTSMHYIFPCIEQINFRAAFQLSLTHPQEWVVISNSSIIFTQQLDNQMKQTKFEKTQPFPCYLYGIFAGDYVCFNDKYKGKIDLNIYCRKEKEEAIKNQLKDLFDITKFGLCLMEEYTQIDFYIKKLDQIFCANYNFYGMENPGCISLEVKQQITFQYKEKRYLFDEEREPLKVMRRAYIMFHEIAHMWFGDYVSLEWWNNLFLKEGFATFFGYKCIKEYFKDFDYGTHMELQKIMVLPDENQKNMITLSHNKLPYYDYCTFKAHNCISYNKGGAFFEFLEQKVYGEQKFKENLRQYLSAHSFNKVEAKDFIKFFPDVFSKQYIFRNHLSYFEDNQFKDLINLGLAESDYDQISLTYYIISKKTKEIKVEKRTDKNTLQGYPSNENIILLNISDQHLIFNRISKENLIFIQENNLVQQFNLEQRITLWKTIIFENIQFEKQPYFNEFFLDTILLEQNPVILHYVMRIYPLFCYRFTVEQEDKLIQLYQEQQNQLTKRIILKNLIRYTNSEKNLFGLLEIYVKEERKVKQKYLKKLKLKIQQAYDSSILKIDQLLNS